MMEFDKFFSYEKDTGLITWLVNKGKARAGSIAGCIQKDGYVYIGLKGNDFLAHRLVWFLHYGVWPSQMLDHVDGNKSNNQIKNLREVSASQNQQNQKKAKRGNSTGLLGVYWHKMGKKFVARITVNGKTRHLGCFAKAEEAHETYLKAKRKLHEGCTI